MSTPRSDYCQLNCEQVLAVFAKYWQPGAVKTRLAATIGDQQASTFYRSCVETLVTRFEGEADSRHLVFTPIEAQRQFANLVRRRQWSVAAQSDGDLGHRLATCVEQLMSETGKNQQPRALVLLGTDSPTLPLEWLRRAFRLLQTHDIVLGPTDDGGYYLVGMRSPYPRLFEAIRWGTDRVWEQTWERLAQLGPSVSVATLPRWYDIDHVGDLLRLESELALAADRGLSPSLTKLYAAVARLPTA